MEVALQVSQDLPLRLRPPLQPDLPLIVDGHADEQTDPIGMRVGRIPAIYPDLPRRVVIPIVVGELAGDDVGAAGHEVLIRLRTAVGCIEGRPMSKGFRSVHGSRLPRSILHRVSCPPYRSEPHAAGRFLVEICPPV
jgi:hypothetical protein